MKELNYVPDIICLGHTHFQQHSILKKPYFFNPGSTNYFLHGNVEEKQYNIDNKTFKGKKIGSYDIMLIQEKIMKIEE
jgi:predicted phosphodiesterase